jgi:hypothetical protein
MPTLYRHATTTAAEKELTQAVRRVVERYGNDLSGYFRRVEEIAKKNAQQSGGAVGETDESREGRGADESAS